MEADWLIHKYNFYLKDGLGDSRAWSRRALLQLQHSTIYLQNSSTRFTTKPAIQKLQLLLLLLCHSPFSGFAYQQAGSRAQKIETNMSAVCTHPNISSINSKQSDSIATLSSLSRRKRASTSRGRSSGSILQNVHHSEAELPGNNTLLFRTGSAPDLQLLWELFSINAFLGASLLLSNLRKEGWD